jgi:(2Fe-2S) ferredoxin
LRGGPELLAEIQKQLLERGATDVLVTACSCLGPCFDGLNAVVYPEGVWYAHLEEADAAAIVAHLVDGAPYAPKVTEPPGD